MWEIVFLVFESVPQSFWGVLAGSLLALSGVMLTNRSNSKRLAEQLKSERQSRKFEYDLELRKEIFLDASLGVSHAIMAIGKIADINVPLEEALKESQVHAPAVGKLSIISNLPLLKANSDFTSEYSVVLMRLAANRLPLDMMKSDIEIATNSREKSQLEIERTLEQMKEFNLSANTDKNYWETLQGYFNFEQERVSEQTKIIDETNLKMIVARSEFGEQCASEAVRLAELTIPIIVQMRKEIDIPIDEEKYRAIVRNGTDKQKENLSKFLSEINSTVQNF